MAEERVDERDAFIEEIETSLNEANSSGYVVIIEPNGRMKIAAGKQSWLTKIMLSSGCCCCGP